MTRRTLLPAGTFTQAHHPGNAAHRFQAKGCCIIPAAQRIHHAERGGLLHHTTGMLRHGQRHILDGQYHMA